METIYSIDYAIFHFINQGLSNDFFDFFLVFWRNSYLWAPLYLFFIAFIFFNFRVKAYWILVFAFLTFGSTDLASSRVIKNYFKRDRPCKMTAGIEVTARVRCGSGYSFTSSHATNHFGLAVFWIVAFGQRFKKIKAPLLIWASLVCLAQVYVGVHYPSDVIVGAILGSSIGYAWGKLFNKFYGLV